MIFDSFPSGRIRFCELYADYRRADGNAIVTGLPFT